MMTTLFSPPREFLSIEAIMHKRKRRKKGKPLEPAPLVKGSIGWTRAPSGKHVSYFWDALCWRLVQPNERKRARRARSALERIEEQHPAVAGHCTD